MLTLGIFGGSTVDGSMLDPGERVIALCLFGGVEIDFSAAPSPPAAEVLVVAVFGGCNIKVRPDQSVRLTGFSLFGGRQVEPRRQLPPPAPATGDDGADLPLEIDAYALFGGVNVERATAVAA